MPQSDWTFWLNVANLAMGILTLASLLVVLGAVGWEFLARELLRARKLGH